MHGYGYGYGMAILHVGHNLGLSIVNAGLESACGSFYGKARLCGVLP